jgi:nucleotide-binding universal stress UspA family protein
MQPRILVPYDFSPASESALRWAVELQRSCGGGAIKLLHVLNTNLPVSIGGELPFPAPTRAEIQQCEEGLREVAGRLAPGAEIEVMLAVDIVPGVLHAAQEWSADLIAMGTHGRGGVKRLLLGSVADGVVRRASCAVLTVRSPE